MASVKAEKPVGTQLFGQLKKEASSAKGSDGSSKSTASKPAAKKAAQKPQEPKKKKLHTSTLSKSKRNLLKFYNCVPAYDKITIMTQYYKISSFTKSTTAARKHHHHGHKDIHQQQARTSQPSPEHKRQESRTQQPGNFDSPNHKKSLSPHANNLESSGFPRQPKNKLAALPEPSKHSLGEDLNIA
ncbi:hypothetical protein REPUB_Repub04eG0265000 [Reevesia pubescens]